MSEDELADGGRNGGWALSGDIRPGNAGISLPPPPKTPSKGAREAMRFCELLPVPAGKLLGQPIKLLPYQKRFLTDLYRTDRYGKRLVRQAVLSLARRGGKSLVAAMLGLIHLCGPQRRLNSVIMVAANDHHQAGIVYKHAADIVRLSPPLRNVIKLVDSTKRLIFQRTNSVMMAVSANYTTKLGMGPDVIIYDEIGNAKNRELFDVLTTSQGSQAEPLMLLISTQAASDEHFFSQLIDYGVGVNSGQNKDTSFLLHLYATHVDRDPFEEASWYDANPALGYSRDLGEMREQAERARAIPSNEPRFRNLLLNQRVQTEAPFLSRTVWEKNLRPASEEIFRTKPVYGGLDLSMRTDLTAAVFVAEDDEGAIHVKSLFWTPEQTLVEREHRDRAPYQSWADHGQLIAVPGLSIRYEYVAAELGKLAAEMELWKVGYDRWAIEVFKNECLRMGVVLPLEPCGQGFASMAAPVELVKTFAIEGRFRAGEQQVLQWCIGNAVVAQDPAGNQKLNKARSFGRIDGAVALVMAIRMMKVDQEAQSSIAPILTMSGGY